MNPLLQQKQSSDEINIGSFFRSLLKRWYYYGIAGVLFLAAALLYYKLTPPVYEANSTILIEDSKGSSPDISEILTGEIFGSSLNLPTEMGILRSRRVIQNAINELGLQYELHSHESYPSHPVYPDKPFAVNVLHWDPLMVDIPLEITFLKANSIQVSMQYSERKLPAFEFSKTVRLNEAFGNQYFKMSIVASDSIALPDEGSEFTFIYRNPGKLILEIQEKLTVQPLEKDANIIKATYEDVVPRRAIAVLNSISQAYIDLDVQDKAEIATITLQFVEDQLANTGRSLNDSEAEMQAFKERNRTVNLSVESQSTLEKLNELDLQRVKNDIELNSLKSLLLYVEQNKDLTSLAPSSMGIPDPVLIQLIANYQQLQSKRMSLAYGVKEDAPSLSILDKQLLEARASLRENIASSLSRLKITQEFLSKELSKYENSIRNVPDVERQLLGMQRNFEVNQNIYKYLLEKKAETSIARATAVSDNKVLDEASLREDPVSPNKLLLIALIALFTAVVPTLFIILQGLMRTSIGSRDDIAQHTDISVLGVVGHSNDSSNLAVLHKPKGVLAESFRTIRTNLQFFGVGKGNKTIMVTSSVGGEGKSFFSINLATILSLQKQKVLIMGLDLRKPKLYDDFGLDNRVGMSNYLAGNLSIDEVIRTTSVEHIDLVSSGPVPPNPSELLNSAKLSTFMEEVKSRYDIIIVDTPPLGIVSDALVIMNHCDLSIFIMRQNYSKIDYIKALNILQKEDRLRNLSIVLNDSVNGSGYSYTYKGTGRKESNGYYEEEVTTGEGISSRIRSFFKV